MNNLLFTIGVLTLFSGCVVEESRHRYHEGLCVEEPAPVIQERIHHDRIHVEEHVPVIKERMHHDRVYVEEHAPVVKEKVDIR